ncbi:MAG: diphosphomevalonate decarboxylase [Bacteroidales bacterium]|nr:diphosphomevalonate decarboxylase [Bacteroidales bacterium]
MCVKGKITYSSPSNIAIVKYWGKEPGDQIPMNPSLSMTLDKCRSFTTVEYEVKKGSDFSVEVIFEGKRSTEIEAKLQRWFTKISYFFSWLKHARLRIESHNNFPHSAGIASSASGMSALAMCLSAIDGHVRNDKTENPQIQSNISRLGSGSASRSVMGPWVIWGKSVAFTDASDEYAVVVPDVHAHFRKLHDTIIVVDKTPKAVSSRDGHTLMEGHPWRKGRIGQANQNFKELIKALKTGDWKLFQKITENEALSLHALMLASKGGMMLWKGDTVEWMHYLRAERQNKGIPLAFTLDAGANIHLLYPDEAREDILQILKNSHVPYIEMIHDQTGSGPEKLFDEYEQC